MTLPQTHHKELMSDLCRCIGYLATAQRSLLLGYPAEDPEVITAINWVREVLSNVEIPPDPRKKSLAAD